MSTASRRHIRTTDMLVIDNVFGMGDGYVLNFSNRTFSEFFAEELGVDFDQPRWSVDGGSKAKRLRTISYLFRQTPFSHHVSRPLISD